MRIKTTVRSLFFAAELRRRAEAFRGQTIRARLVVPDSLAFWYWLEFGTALRGEPGRSSGHEYSIDPVNSLILSWPGEEGRVFRPHVTHPGIRPRAFVRKVLPEIEEQARIDLAASFGYHGITPEAAQFAVEKAMEHAVEQIVDSLSLEAQGTRPDGKLLGSTAAEAFRENAQIITS